MHSSATGPLTIYSLQSTMASTWLGSTSLSLIVILIVILIAKGSLDNIDPSLQVGLLIVRDNWFDGEPTHPFRGWLLSATLVFRHCLRCSKDVASVLCGLELDFVLDLYSYIYYTIYSSPTLPSHPLYFRRSLFYFHRFPNATPISLAIIVWISSCSDFVIY